MYLGSKYDTVLFSISHKQVSCIFCKLIEPSKLSSEKRFSSACVTLNME